jgi:hypothetical protein
MKRIIIAIFVLCNQPVSGQVIQPHIKTTLDTILHYARISSLYSKDVNWDSLGMRVSQKAMHAKNIYELRPAFELILNTLNDAHGSFIRSSDYSRIATFTNWDHYNLHTEDKRPRSREILKIINDTALRFSYAMPEKNTGYLKITGIGPNANKQLEADNIRNAIKELHHKGVDKWIIDLRYNGGGNMNPMMSGIAPILGNGFVGYLSNREKDTLAKWSIRNGNFFWDDYMDIQMDNKPALDPLNKVAVLISRYTISSGEFVANAFKGRKNTRFFGETTGGLTTNTNWVVIGKELIMSISSGVYCDKKGNMYSKNIPEDQPVEFDAENALEKDKGVQAAISWLQEK